MNWTSFLKIALTLAGACCIFSAGWNASRLQLDGATAGLWEWVAFVVLPIIVAASFAVTRAVLRLGDTSGVSAGASIPSWLVDGVRDRATARDPAGLRALTDEVERLAKGGAK